MPSIEVSDYNPAWPDQFEQIKNVLCNTLGNVPVEHVGSTAVPGLAAKPVLDIDIIIKDHQQLDLIVTLLVPLGYQFRGDQGIADRYVFRQLSSLSPVDEKGTIWPKHHLYCCIAGSAALRNHLLLRDALRNSPALAAAYGTLKKGLALITGDMDTYIESKSDFIAGILSSAGISEADTKAIVLQNQKKKN